MDDIAIKVDSVDKNFRLPHEKTSTVKSLFTAGFSKKVKGFEVQQALKNISFEVQKGEFFGIVGRNGSGKSTLLKILAGIYQPTQGKVVTMGRLVPFIELGVGFNTELTGRENVYLNGALLGFSKKEMDKQYNDIVDFAELKPFMDQKLKNYSSGMQVRLAFSLAIRAEADILLVDEVLAVGDADFQIKCFDYFKQLKQNNKTVVFVSHDMNAIREFCDRVILIEKHMIKAEGPATRIASDYNRLFLQSGESSSKTVARWGDEKAKIIKISCTKSLGDDEPYLNIGLEVMANTDIEDPVIGFTIKTGGRQLMGTNTKIEGIKFGQIKKNQLFSADIKVPNIFNTGSYMVDVALVHSDGIGVHDWWEDAASFKCLKTISVPYLVMPKVDIKSKK